MRRPSLSDEIKGKYIICSCEGNAEQAIMDLLIDEGKLCFTRQDLLNEKCTQKRTGNHIADAFLGMEVERDIAILRVLDRRKEKFILPKEYRLTANIPVFDIVTHPEIEILHIIAKGYYQQFKSQSHGSALSASSYCKRYFSSGRNRVNVKSKQFIAELYENNLECLVRAIKEYKYLANQSDYCLADLLIQ